jgi:ketosteroid isomerase-like protein
MTLSIPTLLAVLIAVAATVYSVSVERTGPDRAPAPAPAAPVTAPEASPPNPRPPTVGGDGQIATIEAAVLIDEFRAAYEARDVDRLMTLFAPDASENGRHGLDTIASAYRSSLGGIADIRYTLKSLAVDTRGKQTDVRAPFVVSFRQPGGPRSEIRGTAEWKLERRDGRPRIIELNYRLEPEPEPEG